MLKCLPYCLHKRTYDIQHISKHIVGPLLRRGLYDGERRQSPAAPGAERRDGVKFQLIGTWRFVDENFCEKERQNICKEKQTSNICFPDVEAFLSDGPS